TGDDTLPEQLSKHVCQAGMRIGKCRVQSNGLAENFHGSAVLRFLLLVQELAAAQIELVRSGVSCAATLEPRAVGFEQVHAHRRDDVPRDVLLHAEDVLDLAIE